MKLPFDAGKSSSDFLKSSKEVGTKVLPDGLEVKIYGSEVPAPTGCSKKICEPDQRLRRSGSYMRQVIEGLSFIFVLIYRFRCGQCGGTVSRPPSFLVPYRRFTAKMLCLGIEQYGQDEAVETTYDAISIGLSIFEDAVDEPLPILKREEVLSVTHTRVKAVSGGSKEGFCPARSTVFSWVDFVCKRIMTLMQQAEKELVLRNFSLAALPVESQFTNRNAWKAGTQTRYWHQQNKPKELNKLTYLLSLGRSLVGGESGMLERLRAYFFQYAEKCADILSDVFMLLPIAHTSEHPRW